MNILSKFPSDGYFGLPSTVGLAEVSHKDSSILHQNILTDSFDCLVIQRVATSNCNWD